jgi:hypothetical protein
MSALAEPQGTHAARNLLRAILVSGEVVFSGHALTEMENDGSTQADVIRILRGGTVEPAEFERGSWRYRVRARDAYVLVSFPAESSAVVVTAWGLAQ